LQFRCLQLGSQYLGYWQKHKGSLGSGDFESPLCDLTLCVAVVQGAVSRRLVADGLGIAVVESPFLHVQK
jgi:hypothetical protein